MATGEDTGMMTAPPPGPAYPQHGQPQDNVMMIQKVYNIDMYIKTLIPVI